MLVRPCLRLLVAASVWGLSHDKTPGSEATLGTVTHVSPTSDGNETSQLPGTHTLETVPGDMVVHVGPEGQALRVESQGH